MKSLNAASFLTLATLVVNAANYGLNLLLARWLGPDGFADANVLATVVMLVSFLATGIQLATAKAVAGSTEHEVIQIQTWVRRIVVGMLILSILSLPLVTSYLKLESYQPLLIIYLGLPFYFLMSIGRGVAQGREKFVVLGWSYLVEMISRVSFTLTPLLFSYFAGYAIHLVAIGFLLSFMITYYYLRGFILAGNSISKGSDRTLVKFMLLTMTYEFSQIIINNADIMMVKHYFLTTEAGAYASLTLLGRIVFFLTVIIVTVLFPKVVALHKEGLPHGHLLQYALTIVLALSGGMVLFMFLFGDMIVLFTFGEDYLSTADYLWKYTIATGLFACANVIVYYFLSIEKYIPVILSLTMGLLQIIFITFYHDNFEQVIAVQVICMAVLLALLMGYQFINRISLFHSSEAISTALVTKSN